MNRPLAAVVVLAGALAGAPAAAADTAVVSATVFTGTAGTAAARTVALSTLDACPPYTGPGALTLYPGGSTDTLPAGTTWTLAEILDCGLSIPLSNLNAVEVLRPDGAAQAPLSPAALTDASAYADPAAPGALPVVSNNGGQAQNTYTRPWRGGDDENGRDQVTASGPVQMVVYENTAPLSVHIATRTLRHGIRSERVALSATVQTAAGATVPASSLDWRWTISTGASSAAATPTVTIPQGTATATVVVSDTASGSGGTASIALTYKPVRSKNARSGGGGHGTVHSSSGLGSGHHHGRGGASHRGQGRTTGTTTTTSRTTTAPTTTATPSPTTTSTVTTSATSSAQAAATTPTTATTPAPHPPRTHHRASHPAPARDGTVVQGRLLADVVPVSASQSPLTRPVLPSESAAVASPAPATRITVPAAVIGGIVVLGLLALGGAREQRRRSPRLHR
ncbi:MAG TPA: hypothetical protein VGL69_08575 [Solirubrobacteraceae bacterium]